jgi:hypothetical protein
MMRRRLGIRGKIAAVILLCMIPVLVLAVVLYTRHIADRRSTVAREQEDLAPRSRDSHIPSAGSRSCLPRFAPPIRRSGG